MKTDTSKIAPLANEKTSLKTPYLADVLSVNEHGQVTATKGQSVVQVHHRAYGLPTPTPGDKVLLSEFSNGEVLMQALLAQPGQAQAVHCHIEYGHARIELPENAQSLEITAGEATISLHRNGQLSLN